MLLHAHWSHVHWSYARADRSRPWQVAALITSETQTSLAVLDGSTLVWGPTDFHSVQGEATDMKVCACGWLRWQAVRARGAGRRQCLPHVTDPTEQP